MRWLLFMVFAWSCVAVPPYTTRYTDKWLRFSTDAQTGRELLELTNYTLSITTNVDYTITTNVYNVSTNVTYDYTTNVWYSTNLLDAWTNDNNSVFLITTNGWSGPTNDNIIIVKIGPRAGLNISDYNTLDPGLTNDIWVNSGRGTYIGYSAGDGSIGGRLTAIGHRAGFGATNVNYSTLLGFSAGSHARSGNKATLYGYRAAAASSGDQTFDYATLIGHDVGRYASNCTRSIFIGHEAGSSSFNTINSILIGTDLNMASQTNIAVLGNTNITKTILRGSVFLLTNSAPTVTGTDIALWNSNGVLWAVGAGSSKQLFP